MDFRSSSDRGRRNVAKDKFAVLELDFIAVKGKKEPEVVYAIIGRDEMANSGRFQRWRELNIEMLSRYRSRDWESALAAIEQGRSSTKSKGSRRFTTSIPRASGRSRSLRRPRTGTAPTRLDSQIIHAPCSGGLGSRRVETIQDQFGPFGLGSLSVSLCCSPR